VTVNKHQDDSWKQISHDDVFIQKYYQFRVFSVEDAVKSHRETHHPSMYNMPNAPLFAEIELNMQGEKITRFVENFHRMAPIANKFDHGEDRTILAFAKDQESIEIAKKAGASLVGDAGLIKSIQNGDLSLNDYPYIVAHSNILPELVHVRGLMKRRFPNPKNGTLGTDLAEMIQKFLNGITYSVVKDENQQNFAIVTTQFGTLDMDPKHLESNLASLLQDINKMRPKREGKFVTRVFIKSPPSSEKLKINPFEYVPEEQTFSKRRTSAIAVEEEEDAAAADEEELKEKKEAVN
jgi:large subunit ribosomal protein L1